MSEKFCGSFHRGLDDTVTLVFRQRKDSEYKLRAAFFGKEKSLLRGMKFAEQMAKKRTTWIVTCFIDGEPFQLWSFYPEGGAIVLDFSEEGGEANGSSD